MLIADMMASAGFERSKSVRSVSIALDKAVEVLKSAVPFQLPVCIVTGDLPPCDIALEDADESYAAVLLRWLQVFANKPALEATDLSDLISLVRDIVSEKISSEFERKQPVVPRLLRRRAQDECDLCDDVLIRWLGSADAISLYQLAIRWDLHSLQRNDQTGVLEELGLTDESMFDLSEEQFIRLNLIARLEDEKQRHLSDFWGLLANDPIGIDIHRLLTDTIATIAD